MLKFTYNKDLNIMVSEPITQESEIYIKYNENNTGNKTSDFSIEVQTLNNVLTE